MKLLIIIFVVILSYTANSQYEFCEGDTNCAFYYNVLKHQPLLQRYVNPTKLSHWEYTKCIVCVTIQDSRKRNNTITIEPWSDIDVHYEYTYIYDTYLLFCCYFSAYLLEPTGLARQVHGRCLYWDDLEDQMEDGLVFYYMAINSTQCHLPFKYRIFDETDLILGQGTQT